MNSREMMLVMLASLGLLAYCVRAVASLIARRIDARAHGALHPETDQRMARIEQAVDAIALEVERISEGQRFTTRLLADRAAAVPPLPSSKPPVQS